MQQRKQVKIHEERAGDGGALCGTKAYNPIITRDYDKVTCERCRGGARPAPPRPVSAARSPSGRKFPPKTPSSPMGRR